MNSQQQVIEDLIHTIISGNDQEGHAAEQALANVTQVKVRDLSELVGHIEPRVRYRLAWLLGKISDNMSVTLLAAMTMDRDERVSYDAFMALSHRDDKEAVECILRIAPSLSTSGHPWAHGALAALEAVRNSNLGYFEQQLPRQEFPAIWAMLDGE